MFLIVTIYHKLQRLLDGYLEQDIDRNAYPENRAYLGAGYENRTRVCSLEESHIATILTPHNNIES